MFRKKRSGSGDAVLTLFFATDLHGSDVCFRKFLNARTVYGADVMILGGDLTGKVAVPIVDQGRGKYRVFPPGQPYTVQADKIEQVRANMARAGFYAFVTSSEELQELSEDAELAERAMAKLMEERLGQWATWADQKLQGTSVELIVAPGNDDPWFIDQTLAALPRFRLVEGQVIRLEPGGFEMLSTGYTNRTPWNTHREFDEEEIRERLEGLVTGHGIKEAVNKESAAMHLMVHHDSTTAPREFEENELRDRLEQLAHGVRDIKTAIFNIHPPPYGSQLDEGPIINWKTLEIEAGMGQGATVPVGSHAVREIIEKYQPLLSLHGHIHESRAVTHIGATLAINPGSEYGDGILRGAVIRLGESSVKNYQLTSG